MPIDFVLIWNGTKINDIIKIPYQSTNYIIVDMLTSSKNSLLRNKFPEGNQQSWNMQEYSIIRQLNPNFQMWKNTAIDE